MNQTQRDTLNLKLPLAAVEFLQENKGVIEQLGQCLRIPVKDLKISASPADYYSRQGDQTREPDTFVKVESKDRVLLWFTLSPYNYCCAMNQVNGFGYDNCVKPEFVDAMMTTLQKTVRPYSSQRWVFNFVEPRRNHVLPVDPTEVVEAIDGKPVICFEYLYNWAKRQAKFQEMLFVNQNTGNIIHFCEAVFHE